MSMVFYDMLRNVTSTERIVTTKRVSRLGCRWTHHKTRVERDTDSFTP